MAPLPDIQRPVSTDSQQEKPKVMPRIFLHDVFSRLYEGDGESEDAFLRNGGLHGAYTRVRNVLAQDKFKNLYEVVVKAVDDLRKQTHQLLQDRIPLVIHNKNEEREVMQRVHALVETVRTQLATHDATAELRTALDALEQHMQRAVDEHYDLPEVPGAAQGKADNQGVASGTAGAEHDSKNGVAPVSMDAIHNLALPHVETLVGQIPQHQLSPNLLSSIMKSLCEAMHNGEPFSLYESDYLRQLVMVTAESMIIDDLWVDLSGGMVSVEDVEDLLKTHAFPSGTIWHQSSAHKLLRLCVQQKSFSRSLHMKRRMSEWGYDRLAVSDAASRKSENRTGGQTAASSSPSAAASGPSSEETTVQDFSPLEEQHLVALFTERYRKNEPFNMDFMRQARDHVNVRIHGAYERTVPDMRRFEKERWPTYLQALQGSPESAAAVQPASVIATVTESLVEDFDPLEEAFLIKRFTEQHNKGETFNSKFVKQVCVAVNAEIHDAKKRTVEDIRHFEKGQWRRHLEVMEAAARQESSASFIQATQKELISASGFPSSDALLHISNALLGRKSSAILDQSAIDTALARVQRGYRRPLKSHEKEWATTLLHVCAEYRFLTHVLPGIKQSRRTPYKIFLRIEELYVTRAIEGKSELSTLIEGFVHGKSISLEQYIRQRLPSLAEGPSVASMVTNVPKKPAPVASAIPSASADVGVTPIPVPSDAVQSVGQGAVTTTQGVEEPSPSIPHAESDAGSIEQTGTETKDDADDEATPPGPVETFDDATIAREEALMNRMFVERLQAGKTIDKSFRNKVCNELNDKIHLGQKKRHKSYVRDYYDDWLVESEKQKTWDNSNPFKVPEPPPAELPAGSEFSPSPIMPLSSTETTTVFGGMSAVHPLPVSYPKPSASAETEITASPTPATDAPPAASADRPLEGATAVPVRPESPEQTGGIQLYVDRTRAFLTTLLSKVPTAEKVTRIFSNFRVASQRAIDLRTILKGTEKLLTKDVGAVVHLAVPSSVSEIVTLDAQGLRDEIVSLKMHFDFLKNYRDILRDHHFTFDELAKQNEKAQLAIGEMQAMQKHIRDLKDFRDGPFPPLLEGAALKTLVPGANDASFDVEPEVSVDVDRYVHDLQQEMIVFTVRPEEEFYDEPRRERLLESIAPTLYRLKQRRTDCLAALNELEMK